MAIFSAVTGFVFEPMIAGAEYIGAAVRWLFMPKGTSYKKVLKTRNNTGLGFLIIAVIVALAVYLNY